MKRHVDTKSVKSPIFELHQSIEQFFFSAKAGFILRFCLEILGFINLHMNKRFFPIVFEGSFYNNRIDKIPFR